MTRLALVAAVLIVLAGAWLTGSGRAQEPVPISVAAPLSSDELRELTYPNDFTASGFASLSDGSYREVAAPGSAAFIDVRLQRSAFGELNGAPAAAVVLATAGGGSGTFFDLHVIVRDGDGAPTIAAQRALGDRIRLQDLRFAAGLVRVDFTGFAPSDPLCCPTLNVVHGFELVDGTLQLVRGQEAPRPAAGPGRREPSRLVRRADHLHRHPWFGWACRHRLGLRHGGRMARRLARPPRWAPHTDRNPTRGRGSSS